MTSSISLCILAFAPIENPLGAGTHPNTLQIAAIRKGTVLRVRGWTVRPSSVTMTAMPKTKPVRCEDCYFHQNMLCALNLDKPCTTFRPAERGLEPERQLAFVFRAERTTATYAFPQPNG
jgi:hypothetical protein